MYKHVLQKEVHFSAARVYDSYFIDRLIWQRHQHQQCGRETFMDKGMDSQLSLTNVKKLNHGNVPCNVSL